MLSPRMMHAATKARDGQFLYNGLPGLPVLVPFLAVPAEPYET
jgi:hypothetical protein